MSLPRFLVATAVVVLLLYGAALLLVPVLALVLTARPAHAWGGQAHQFIVRQAIEQLPPALKPFFEAERDGNAEIYVQKNEYEFLRNPHPVDHRYYPDILDGLNVIPVEGDVEIADGVQVVFSPGHTVGGQSVAVNTAKGKAVITGFCCNDKNFPSQGPAIAPGVVAYLALLAV